MVRNGRDEAARLARLPGKLVAHSPPEPRWRESAARCCGEAHAVCSHEGDSRVSASLCPGAPLAVRGRVRHRRSVLCAVALVATGCMETTTETQALSPVVRHAVVAPEEPSSPVAIDLAIEDGVAHGHL